MSSIVREKLEDYFASVNGTSGRMMADIISCREGKETFDSLPYDEQSDLIWRSIVKPEAAKKYEKLPSQEIEVESFPVLRILPGEKIIIDEDPSTCKTFSNTWRDEHSAPFRWETQSQLDLRLDGGDSDSEKPKTLEKQKQISKSKESVRSDIKEDGKRSMTIKRPEVPPPPVPPHFNPPVPPHCETPPVPPPHVAAEKSDTPIYAKVMKRKSAAKTLLISELKAHRKAKEDMKPAVPPRMSLELRGEIDITKYKTLPIDFDDIPKTGFDFLDNW